jgi:hypothetical protein
MSGADGQLQDKPVQLWDNNAKVPGGWLSR